MLMRGDPCPSNERMQPTSLDVTAAAPLADARDAPAAPLLTLAGDTQCVRHMPAEQEEK